MNVKTQNKEERLRVFQSLYEDAKNRVSDLFSDLDRHREQYRGSDKIDGSAVRAATVRNITYEIIESQVSSDIPAPKVDAACYSDRRTKNAKSIERLLSSVRDRLSYEEMNDKDERFTYIYGGSVWFLEWDNSVTVGGEVGGVKLSCLSPKAFIPQPGIMDVDDMDYCFLRFSTTKDELCRRYGVNGKDVDLASAEIDSDAALEDEDVVTVVLCFYRDERGEVGQFIFSGDLVLSDISEYYHRKTKVCRACGGGFDTCSCKKPKWELLDQPVERLSHTLALKDGKSVEGFCLPGEEKEEGLGFLSKETDVPYYVPHDFPIVIRKNTSGEESHLGQSDCEYLRPEQQAINKIESRILEKLLRAGVTPVVPEGASVTVNNAIFGQVIRMKPGETAAQYGKVDTTPDISQDIAEAERLYLHAKRILGVSDAYVGIGDLKVESGYARQLQISQASGRLESKRKMKHTAYADMDRLIFEHYLAFADEPRKLSYRDAFGRVHDAAFCRYDFLEYDKKSGTYYYDDSYLFSVDLSGGAESQRETLWEKNLENLKSGALGDPTSPMTLLRYWQCQERAHYPFAAENVAYFESSLGEGGNLREP